MNTLTCERLEDRACPSTVAATFNGAFFLNASHQLWFYDAGTRSVTNTGAYATDIAAGASTILGNECWFIDGNHQVWHYNHGSFSNTGAYAKAIKADWFEAVFTDGNNQLWTLGRNDLATPTGVYALSFDVGYDAVNANHIVIVDGNHQVWLQDPGGPFKALGAYATQVSAGQDLTGLFQFWFTDGTNRVWQYLQGQFMNVANYATELAGGARGTAYATDGNGELYALSNFATVTPLNKAADNISSNPNWNDMFFTDANGRLWEYVDNTFILCG